MKKECVTTDKRHLGNLPDLPHHQIRNKLIYPITKTNYHTKKAIRCKYCYRTGHLDSKCPDKDNKRPPSMPEWISKVRCLRCKKKGHLAFNCPPKYSCKVIKANTGKNNIDRRASCRERVC